MDDSTCLKCIPGYSDSTTACVIEPTHACAGGTKYAADIDSSSCKTCSTILAECTECYTEIIPDMTGVAAG